MKKYCIGIDLGTTFSCVGVWKNGKPEIIDNEFGERFVPSYIGFSNTERIIGKQAKNQVSTNPKNTIYDIKRLIGRKFSDPVIQDDIKHYSFDVISQSEDKPYVQVKYKNELKTFSPEEISSMILGKMKNIAETYIGCSVTDAVITVPAYFNDSQRQATRDAGIIAGLNVLRIINEPTASAIAYGLNNKTDQEYNILVFDLGGGTFDVSILTVANGIFEVIATGGDTHLGGEDFDNILVDYCMKDYEKKNNESIAESPKAIRRLRTACENAKIALSGASSTTIDIDSLYEGNNYNITITRSRFEMLCEKLFQKTITVVENVLKDAKMNKNNINEILLVGGSSRVPKVQELLSSYFNGKQLCKNINPDEAVALGATIQAAILSEMDEEHLGDLLLLDVNPLSLGIEISGGIMSKIIDKNTKIPVKKTQRFSTFKDNQIGVTIQVFEGERYKTEDNHKLGEFYLSGIPLAPRGIPQIDVTFHLDTNGILSVTAEECLTKVTKQIAITNDKGRLTKNEIERMINESEKFKEDDIQLKESIEAKNNLENYIFGLRTYITNQQLKEKIQLNEIKIIEDTIQDGFIWLDYNTNNTKQIYDDKQKEYEKIINPIIIKMYAENGNKNTEVTE